jgi:uroporphyrinogen-III synthase
LIIAAKTAQRTIISGYDAGMAAFGGASVLALESRRAKEIGELIRINGGIPFVAPAMREIPIAENQEAFRFADSLHAGEFDMVILLTGVGTRYLGKVIASREPEDQWIQGLRRLTVIARGPKPAAVLREWQVPITVQVPEPNTYRELLTAIENVPGKRVAVQEYGRPNPELLAGLRAQGRTVMNVPVYQWALPEDTEPLKAAVQGLIAGNFGAVLFTTGVQIEHLLQVADRTDDRKRVTESLRHTFIGSIGPTCSEALREAGLWPALEPSHPKMGLLVREAAILFGNTRTELHSA